MTLKAWLQNSWLVRHETSAQEIGDLFRITDRDLIACQVKDLPADWRLAIAYNAGLQAATAALAASGYRASRDGHHMRVIQSLEYTLHVDRALIKTFQAFRKKRNTSSYDVAGAISEREAGEMLQLAGRLRKDIEQWIRKTRPELLKKS